MSQTQNITRGFGSPGRYIQGPHVLDDLFKYTALYGNKVFAVIDIFFYEDYRLKYIYLAKQKGCEFACEKFGGEASEREIDRVTETAKFFAPDVVVGIGGGKTLDTAKAVSNNCHVPVIVAPTTASTDAPCSALSIIYKENGEHSHSIRSISNPNIVLVDSDVIAKAPVRFLVAGMGDALTTFFEARANDESDSPNFILSGYRRTKTAMAVAKACYEILLKDGLAAKLSASEGLCTEAVENIIEANTLLSGLGFENTGVAGAHSVADGITALPQGAKSLHGERGAFGVICQLVSEGRSMKEIHNVISFNLSIGLPVTLEDLGVEPTEENVKVIAEASMHCFWKNEPFATTVQKICQDILAANVLGKHYKLNRG